MSFYAVIQYIKYRLKAKNRHGIHSPFVYELIDKCLLSGTGDLYGERLPVYFGRDNILRLSKDPAAWQVDELLSSLNNDIVVIIPGIHFSEQHNEQWNKIISDERVLLTIDLYEAGLVVNRKEFKEKQHFILKTQ